jgi:hypothetical protein
MIFYVNISLVKSLHFSEMRHRTLDCIQLSNDLSVLQCDTHLESLLDNETVVLSPHPIFIDD